MNPADLTTILTALAHLDAPIASADAESVTIRSTKSISYGRGGYEDETYYLTFTFAELLDPAQNTEVQLIDLEQQRWDEAHQTWLRAEAACKAQEEKDRVAAAKRTKAKAERNREANERAELVRLQAKYGEVGRDRISP